MKSSRRSAVESTDKAATLAHITPPSAVALPERWARPTPQVDPRRLKRGGDCGACGASPEEHHGPQQRCPKPMDPKKLVERVRRDKLSGRSQMQDDTLRHQKEMQTFLNQVAVAQHATLRVLS